MNTVQRFFRRYVFSMVGTMILFFAVNIALFSAIIIAGSMSGSDSSFSIGEFSDHVILQGGNWVADDAAISMLREESAWAMLLNEDGDVVWQQDLPENLPRSYTSAEVASFSRWYLEDYPVKIWTRADGCLMVVGFQPGTLVKYYFSLEWPYMGVMFAGIGAVFIGNLVFIVFLVLRNTRRVERAMTPILEGIQNLSHGRAQYLKEQGELAEINAGLNRAADYMRKKDNTRAEWIRGVSHDIRTPLSMVLGYASELENDRALPQEARKQAGIIRREGEKMRRLIDELNLTTKLEYALQPIRFKDVDWVEISRQAVSEVLNGGLESRYELIFTEMHPGRPIHLLGDDGLLRRMLDNLIRNSITHNPQGCRIVLSVGEGNGRCLCMVSDDGMGIAPEFLKVLNRGNDIASTREGDESAEHGLGLKLVMQIVKAHRGTICFDDSVPHGLEVRISLPVLLNKDQSRNSHGYDTRDDGNQVLTGKLRRGDAADGGDGNHAPGDDGAAAYPDGRDLTQSGQNSGIEACGCGEGASDGANQRKAGKAGAVQSGDDAHKDFDDHTENIVDGHMGGDKVADII